MRRRRRLVSAGALLALVSLPLAATAASAHDSLVGAAPAADSTVSAVAEVTLRFNDAPLGMAGSNVIQVVGPDGQYYETDCPTLSGPQVSAPVALGAAGDYQVRWRVVSSDGHPVAGEYGFAYRPDPDSSTPAGGSATPRCGEAGAGSTSVDAAPSPGRSTAAGTDASAAIGASAGVWIGAAGGSGAIVVVAVAVWLVLRRPAPRDPGIESDSPIENPTQRKERA